MELLTWFCGGDVRDEIEGCHSTMACQEGGNDIAERIGWDIVPPLYYTFHFPEWSVWHAFLGLYLQCRLMEVWRPADTASPSTLQVKTDERCCLHGVRRGSLKGASPITKCYVILWCFGFWVKNAAVMKISPHPPSPFTPSMQQEFLVEDWA